jgi:hypothetical protein
MAILKFRKFEDVDRLEAEGKGISRRFDPDGAYFKKALRFQIKAPIPHGLYKFKTFEDAEIWEREWWIKNGVAKRTR